MIGKMEKVKLRSVWKNEAKDFSSWLFDNLDFLSEELDLKLTPVEKEKRIGTFSADILAEDIGGEMVIIENQLRKTDHDHLGKILTYISNVGAKIAIWITSSPRPEHERAIEWLNQANMETYFYLLKVEAFKIGNSEPAPKFTIISGPSETAINIGEEKKELSERHKKRLKFWKSLLEKSKKKTNLHSNITAGTDSWIGTGAGKSGLAYNYGITYKNGQIELYIDRGDYGENKKFFDYLFKNKEQIEGDFRGMLEWQRLDNRRASRIRKIYSYANLNDEEKWGKLQEEMIDDMIRLEKALKKYINKI
ncbi:MAG: DUF4268 domain-containing protein [Actinomycetota bacterium]|nr:DUF4268 domain-containing protein [Actinomycetota bacterium]